jgi:hypothetical protein
MTTGLFAVGVAIITVAAPSRAQSGNELKKCDKPFGVLAVNEPQEQYLAVFERYQLGSPAALLRMMAQSSKCFLVVERGVAMQNVQQERALASSGGAQAGSNMGDGQMKLADFVLTATVQVSNNNSGGIGGGLGGLVGRGAGVVGGALKFKEAETSLLLSDVRTTVQMAAAQGKAKKRDFRLGALGIGGGAVGAIGGYTNTAEGKVIAASYLDNFNQLTDQMRADPSLMARADKFKPDALGGDETKAGATFAEGDVLGAKIDNIKLYAEAKDGAKELATLKKGDDLVFLGQEKEGYLKVQGSSAEGWVKKSLVTKR